MSVEPLTITMPQGEFEIPVAVYQWDGVVAVAMDREKTEATYGVENWEAWRAFSTVRDRVKICLVDVFSKDSVTPNGALIFDVRGHTVTKITAVLTELSKQSPPPPSPEGAAGGGKPSLHDVSGRRET